MGCPVLHYISTHEQIILLRQLQWDKCFITNQLSMLLPSYVFVVQGSTPHLMRLQYRAWLIHWSLFVYFNHPKGQDEIIKIFLYEQE